MSKVAVAKTFSKTKTEVAKKESNFTVIGDSTESPGYALIQRSLDQVQTSKLKTDIFVCLFSETTCLHNIFFFKGDERKFETIFLSLGMMVSQMRELANSGVCGEFTSQILKIASEKEARDKSAFARYRANIDSQNKAKEALTKWASKIKDASAGCVAYSISHTNYGVSIYFETQNGNSVRVSDHACNNASMGRGHVACLDLKASKEDASLLLSILS